MTEHFSCSAGKELGNLHSVLASKELNKLKKQLFLDLKRSDITGQNTVPRIEVTDRQMHKITTYLYRNLHGTSARVRKLGLYLTNCSRLSVNNNES